MTHHPLRFLLPPLLCVDRLRRLPPRQKDLRSAENKRTGIVSCVVFRERFPEHGDICCYCNGDSFEGGVSYNGVCWGTMKFLFWKCRAKIVVLNIDLGRRDLLSLKPMAPEIATSPPQQCFVVTAAWPCLANKPPGIYIRLSRWHTSARSRTRRFIPQKD